MGTGAITMLVNEANPRRWSHAGTWFGEKWGASTIFCLSSDVENPWRSPERASRAQIRHDVNEFGWGTGVVELAPVAPKNSDRRVGQQFRFRPHPRIPASQLSNMTETSASVSSMIASTWRHTTSSLSGCLDGFRGTRLLEVNVSEVGQQAFMRSFLGLTPQGVECLSHYRRTRALRNRLSTVYACHLLPR